MESTAVINAKDCVRALPHSRSSASNLSMYITRGIHWGRASTLRSSASVVGTRRHIRHWRGGTPRRQSLQSRRLDLKRASPVTDLENIRAHRIPPGAEIMGGDADQVRRWTEVRPSATRIEDRVVSGSLHVRDPVDPRRRDQKAARAWILAHCLFDGTAKKRKHTVGFLDRCNLFAKGYLAVDVRVRSAFISCRQLAAPQRGGAPLSIRHGKGQIRPALA